MGGSEYVKVVHSVIAGDSPKLDLNREKKLQGVTLDLIRKKLINSAHDVSEGGIAVALAECCIMNEERLIGAEINIPVKKREDFSIFSESQSRIIVSIVKDKKEEFERLLKKEEQIFTLLGRTGGNIFKLNNKINIDLKRLSDLYYNTITRIMAV
jgi:phosphoribosylformylglycinamidine synthase